MVQLGTIIDEKYEIVGRLGVGGFGEVYRAVHKQFERGVAIKMLSAPLLEERDVLPRFEREAKAISALKHRNIVGFYGYGNFQQAPYMVMELIEGTSLDRVMGKEGPFDEERVLKLMVQIFDALESAHKVGVVHRDLKPSNIMLVKEEDGKETVKIIDFGLVKLLPGYGVPGQKLTETGTTLGTCHYMPPEQATGMPIDQRADIYSAGCLLYHMLNGHVPFDGDSNVQVLFLHINEKPRLPLRTTSAALKSIVENCMAKEPHQRYESCTAVLSDLRALMESKGGKVRIKQRVRFTFRPTARTKRIAGVLAGVLVLGAAVASVVWHLSSSEEQKEEAQRQKAIAFIRQSGPVQVISEQQYERINEITSDQMALKKFPLAEQALIWAMIADYFWQRSEKYPRDFSKLTEKKKYQVLANKYVLRAVDIRDQIKEPPDPKVAAALKMHIDAVLGVSAPQPGGSSQ